MSDPSSLPHDFPETFDIGRRNRNVNFLVHPQQLRGHLSMLHAFHKLRMTVESEVPSFPREARDMEPEQRWGWFVNIAVERFERWCKNLDKWDLAKPHHALPPLDVMMVWHAYLLNPIWYAEDCGRKSTPEALRTLTYYLSANIGTPDVFITNLPHPRRVRRWERYTGTRFDPFKAGPSIAREIVCPHCELGMVVPFIGPYGTGYAQKNFSTTCTSCRHGIDKKSLGLYKFAKDIADASGFLAGTLHTADAQYDSDRATLIKKRVMRILRFTESKLLTASLIMGVLRSKSKPLSVLLNGELEKDIARRILGAYTDDRPFSIELAGAVLRQASFVRKMVDLRWTDSNFFAGQEELVLLHCIARYHAFLGLMADVPGIFFVPTLDIDLAWHTHQLRGNYYHAECKKYVGRYVNHDDKVDENHLSNAFDTTCRIWNERYRLPYTYCGCPLPGKTLGQRLFRAFSRYRASELDALKLRPPPVAVSGTHASDHNAVYVMHDPRAAENSRTRSEKVARRIQVQTNSASDSGGGTVAYAHTAKDEDEDRKRNTDRRGYTQDREFAHEVAFLYPIPMLVGNLACVTPPTVVGNGACATGIESYTATCASATVSAVSASQASASAVHASEASTSACGGGTSGGGSAAVSSCGGRCSSGGGVSTCGAGCGGGTSGGGAASGDGGGTRGGTSGGDDGGDGGGGGGGGGCGGGCGGCGGG